MVQELYEKYLYFQAQLCHSEKFYSFTLRKEYYENYKKHRKSKNKYSKIHEKYIRNLLLLFSTVLKWRMSL